MQVEVLLTDAKSQISRCTLQSPWQSLWPCVSLRVAKIYIELGWSVPQTWPRIADRRKIVDGEGADHDLCSRPVSKVSLPPGHLFLSILSLFNIFSKTWSLSLRTERPGSCSGVLQMKSAVLPRNTLKMQFIHTTPHLTCPFWTCWIRKPRWRLGEWGTAE